MKKTIAAAAVFLIFLGSCSAEAAGNDVVEAYNPVQEFTAVEITTEAASAPAETVRIVLTEETAPETEPEPEPLSITLLGPNMVYTGESFAYRCEITGEPGTDEILWECSGETGEIAPDGTYTALEKGTVTLTVTIGEASDTLTVHNVETAEDVDFVPEVNGIPIVNKTYPLPPDYFPGDITAETAAAFQELVDGAAEDGIEIIMTSGFRSYWYQKEVHEKWIERYDEWTADTISARAGFSEHQLGMAIDVNSVLSDFADTPEGIWLGENCWKYGFIIRYPAKSESVTGYIYEPWHIRYLGNELAEKVTKSGLCLEDYLGIDSYYR